MSVPFHSYAPGLQPHVSVVDDDASIREALSDLLDSAGCIAESFASSEAFLNSDALFASDVIITDIHMDGLDGLALLQHLRNDLGSKVPVIVITALIDETLRARATDGGCFAFFRKPVEAESLFSSIREAVSAL